MKLLAIDTATEACSVAVWLDGAIYERYELTGREHSRLLPAMLHGLVADCGIDLSQIDCIASGVGPGSFAGVRIGVGFVKGLAMGLDCPVVPVSSLAMLAQGAIRLHGAERVLAAIDARMNEVYFCRYAAVDGLAVAQGEAVVSPPATLALPADGVYAAVGSGWKTHLAALRERTGGATLEPLDGEIFPRARDALPLAQREFADGRGIGAGELLPVYLRNRVALTKVEQEAARKQS